jgi:cytochrome oxidase assembly protein ShyY1
VAHSGWQNPLVFRPRWVAFHLACLLGIVVMVNLSFWQLRRLDDKRDFNRIVTERSQLDPVDVASLDFGSETEIDSLDWRAVGAVGTYATDEQVVVVNRSQNGVAGVNVVTPLVLDDGRAIAIVRGFLPLSQVDSPPDAPEGEVRLVGTLRESDERRTGQPADVAGDVEQLLRLDVARLQEQVDFELLPMYVLLEVSAPADSDLLAPVVSPDLSEGPHLSYAVQWLIFAVAVVVGWVLAVQRSRRAMRRKSSTTSGP